MSKIALIDGNSLMFRSYYATAYTGNLMKTKEGVYTNALFGFCNMLTKLLEDDYEYVFVAFDAGKKTFRHQQYTEYKGTRKQLPDELRVQIPIIKEYLDILNIKRLEDFDFEADDLIASASEMLNDGSNDIFVISGDKDLLQLVKGKINVCLTKKGVGELDVYNEENFKEKMGFEPLQILDYKGLVGDTSDNLPGIKGVGEKTAIKLINQYGSLEGIYEHIGELKGKTQELFINGKETAFTCKYLATLRKDANINYSKEDLKLISPNREKLVEFFTKYEFASLLKKIQKEEMNEVKVEQKEIVVSKSFTQEDFSDGYIVSEVFKSNYYNGEFLGISLILDNKKLFFTKDEIINNELLKEYLKNDNYKKRTFDYKMLYFVLKRLGIEINGVDFDLLLAGYLINPSFASDDFHQVASNFNSNAIPYYDNIYGANTKMAIPSYEVYSNYSLQKALFIKENYQEILKTINEEELEYLFNIEMKLSVVLANMENVGLKIDVNKLDNVGKIFEDKIKSIAEDIYFIAGEEFNINSPKQLGEVLFERLHLPHGKKNKTGFSTSVEVLEKLSKDFVIAKNVLEYRAYSKLLSTYINGLKEVKDENDFIHPLYKQALTQTGRLSSVEPNIQNMPVRTETGQVIREAFISRFENGAILTSDYSQVELRVLAEMSQDPKMIESFNSGIDFHSQTASELYEVKLEDVTKDMRRTAKAINFGIIYGMSAWGLSETIDITPIEANMYINKYFDTYSKAKECLDEFINSSKRLGYSKTLFNRRRYIPEVNSDNGNLRSFGERTAMNSPIQGTAADIIKIAMVDIYEEMKKQKLKSLMIAQVHDELIFDCVEEELEIVRKIVKEKMEGAVKLSIPLIADSNSGENWFVAK